MNDTSEVVIKPVSQWTTLAVQCKRAGCPSVSAFVLWAAMNCCAVPKGEIGKIRRAWREDSQ